MSELVKIRRATATDFDGIWPILHEVFARGDTYAYSPETDKDTAYNIWMASPIATYVAVSQQTIVGTYYIKYNQPGLGSHVCNAGYMVSSAARGRGIGRAMCIHSLEEAKKLGFKAMQFNLVVSTNMTAVALWEDLGFEIVGTLPKAFNHKEKGLVDAFVMYQLLGNDT